MFGRATIGLGIGPYSSSGIKTEALGMVDCNKFILLQISSSLIMAAL